MKFSNITEAIQTFEKEHGVQIELSSIKGFKWFVSDIDSQEECQSCGVHFENDEKLMEMINQVC